MSSSRGAFGIERHLLRSALRFTRTFRTERNRTFFSRCEHEADIALLGNDRRFGPFHKDKTLETVRFDDGSSIDAVHMDNFIVMSHLR